MPKDEDTESTLKYLLKINEMILISSEKQTLTECIASMLGIQSTKLHQNICTHLRTYLDEEENRSLLIKSLPRKLSFIRDDRSILEDYRKYPDLHNFMKITLEMVSQIYRIKITLYSINSQGLLTGIIINEKGYQEQIKLARVDRNFYEVRDGLYMNHFSSKENQSSSSQSYNLYEAFDIEPLPPKKFEPKSLQTLLAKSFSHIPGSPLIKKHVSLCEQNFLKSQEAEVPLQIPNLSQINHSFDELSLQNLTDSQTPYQNLTDSSKLRKQDLSQSRNLTKTPVQPSTPTIIPRQEEPQEEIPAEEPSQQCQNGAYYGYYTQHVYYPSQFAMGQSQTSTKNQTNFTGNYNNLTQSVSLSPGKNNVVKRMNTAMEINQNERYTGRLKFFDQGKNYGFIIMDADESDIFVHCDDLQKAGISKERVRSYKQSQGVIRFSFKVMSYFGKYRQSRKAVELIIIDDPLGMPSLYS